MPSSTNYFKQHYMLFYCLYFPSTRNGTYLKSLHSIVIVYLVGCHQAITTLVFLYVLTLLLFFFSFCRYEICAIHIKICKNPVYVICVENVASCNYNI